MFFVVMKTSSPAESAVAYHKSRKTLLVVMDIEDLQPQKYAKELVMYP